MFLRRYSGTFQDYRIELEEILDLGDHRVLVRFSESAFRADTDRAANFRA